MQATVLRATGWEVAQFLRQPVADVFDLMAQMAAEPPTHRILGWKYKLLKEKPRKLSSAQMAQQHGELAGTLGQPTRTMPQWMRDQIRWAEDQLAKLRK